MRKTRKRWLSLFMAIMMTLTMIPASALSVMAADKAGDFQDVTSDKFYYNPVLWAVRESVTSGTTKTTFSPGDNCTRGQIVTFLYKAGKGTPVSQTVRFADVTENKFYFQPVSWAVSKNITAGTSKTRFSPSDPCTRAQAVTFLWRAAGSPKVTGKNAFSDVKESSFYAQAVAWAVSKKITSGLTETTFGPNYTCTRGQIVTFLYQYYHKDDHSKDDNKGTDTHHDNGSTEPKGDQNTVTVHFDTNGGNKIEDQKIKKGQTAEEPRTPEKKNCTFIGWYEGNGFSFVFDFKKTIEKDTTVYAKWKDDTDKTDTDQDGLTDSLEKEFGTDPTKDDTDGDGISDFVELNYLDYDPLHKDTNQEGKSDADKDCDEDGLSNIEEIHLGTNTIDKDTDHDALTDYEEVKTYHTDPLKADTDGDGVTDGKEVLIGSDPLKAETSFTTNDPGETTGEANPVAAAASVVTDAAGAGTLQIEDVTPGDNTLLSPSIPGYLGNAYSFSTEGTFESATLTFSYDTSLGTIGEDFQPRIYYYNEDTQLLEELPDQTVTDGKVSVSVPHFSTYILLNKVEFDKVWEEDIKQPESGSDKHYDGVDVVFVLDSSGSMRYNDGNGIRRDAAKAFVDKLGENDRGAVVDFDNYANVYQNFTDNHENLKKAIDRVDDSGGTDLSAGIEKAQGLFDDENSRQNAYKTIVFLTDGDGYYNTKDTQTAKDNNIVIYTIGLGAGVQELTLKDIAEGTGGKYYFASAADVLPDIYQTISEETVDYTTDSNNDGISDYYTKLLNDGKLTFGTGACDLVDCIDMYGADNPDWDGDGLKNGEEVSIKKEGNKVYVKMLSNPRLVDSDGDGLSDFKEAKLGMAPLKPTSNHLTSLEALLDKNNDHYTYTSSAEDESINSKINALFIWEWERKDKAKEYLIDYFYDNASEESVKKNEEEIEKQAKWDTALKWLSALDGICKSTKDVMDMTDDLDEMSSDMSDEGDAKEFIDQIKSKQQVIKGASVATRSSRKKILDGLNAENFDKKEIPKIVLSDTDTIFSTVNDLDDLCSSSDFAETFKNSTTYINDITSIMSSVVSTVKKCQKDLKYKKLNTGYKKLSDGYQKFLDGKKEVSKDTWIGVAFDVADGAIDAAKTCNNYAKMQANRDAYISNIELFNYAAEHGKEECIRTAAREVADDAMDESWSMYEKDLKKSCGKTAVITTVKIVADITADLFPPFLVAKTVYDGIMLDIKISGIGDNAEMILHSRTIKAISDGCVSYVNDIVEKDESSYSFSYSSSDVHELQAYLTQLAQSRIAGEEFVRDRLKKVDLSTIMIKIFAGATPEEADKNFKVIITSIKDNAKDLKVLAFEV